MASLIKLSRDRKKKNAPYYVQFLDHLGKRRTTRGCSDKGVSAAKGAKIETVVEQIKLGLATPADLEALLGRDASDGLDGIVGQYEQSLKRKENTAKHTKLTLSRIRLVIAGCGFTTLAELNSDQVEKFVSDYCRKKGLGHRTYNHYLQAIDGFGNWLAHPKRRILKFNPFAGIERKNNETDVRHRRRALSTREIALLIETARGSNYLVQCYDGETRARIYTLSYMTGLRKGELASLTPQSFNLEGEQPTLTVEAKSSKRRRRDTLPLHRDLVPQLRQWIAGLTPTAPLFPKLARRKAYQMIRRDLAEAGIPFETDEGVADFHAAGRHTHITGLLRSGVKLVEAKELARHSDVRMTMKYTHIGLDDQAKAVNQLPSMPVPEKCLHIVCKTATIRGISG